MKPLDLADLKGLIIESLDLEGMNPDDIGDAEALFGERLGLDSVDALELVVAVEKRYGIKIQSRDIDPEVFRSAATLHRFLEKQVVGRG